MKREEKATAVAELTEKFGRARLAIVTESAGLSVNQVTELRKQLRGAKAEYKVMKNTLAIRASRRGRILSISRSAIRVKVASTSTLLLPRVI